jgi:hypothetical protein
MGPANGSAHPLEPRLSVHFWWLADLASSSAAAYNACCPLNPVWSMSQNSPGSRADQAHLITQDHPSRPSSAHRRQPLATVERPRTSCKSASLTCPRPSPPSSGPKGGCPQVVRANLLLQSVNDGSKPSGRRNEIPTVQSRSSGLTSSLTNMSAQSSSS